MPSDTGSKSKNEQPKKPSLLSPDRCAELLKALADKDRLRIIEVLRRGPHSVSEIASELQVELANASHHLGVLRHAKLVYTERRGKQIIYALPDDVLQANAGQCDHLDLGCCRLELPN